MSLSHGSLPRPEALQAALRKITEALAGELGCPTPRAPAWSEFEWIIATAVAALHGVSPLLSLGLRWPGPPGWRNFLDDQKAHTANRQARIEELLQRIDQRARAHGVAAVALKGAALHSIGLYRCGERPMADLDLLVRPRDTEAAARLIESLGYQESEAGWNERVFVPLEDHAAAALGEHSNNNIKIELHEQIAERLPRQTTEVTQSIFPARPHPGLNAYPSNAALMIHLLLHAAGAMVIQSLRLLQLNDLALLASRMSAADWDEMLGYGAKSGSSERRLWWALPPLELASRYYASAFPARVLAALEADCPWHLSRTCRQRTLSDVSYSHLWVDAFPGIEWSRSVHEMLEYTLSRVRPGALHVSRRNSEALTQAWASHSEWSTLSQPRRILRWVTSRQTRPVTMHVVRAALAQAL